MSPTFIAGFDGTDGSRAAVHFATPLDEEGVAQRIARPGGAAQALIEAADDLEAELEVEVCTEVGAPREAIVAACTDDIDLLVTGSRAYGPLHATLVGSVSHYLAAHARCPVIVVPRQLQQADAIMAGASMTPRRTG